MIDPLVQSNDPEPLRKSIMKLFGFVIAAVASCAAFAQVPAPKGAETVESKTPDPASLASLAWLEGCWRGAVNQREYREQWMPLRGELLVGVSQTVSQGRTEGYEYLRIEPRADGVYYVASPPGRKESAFRLTEQAVDRTNNRNDEIFGFVNTAPEFPQKIIYRRASEGWLYAAVEGKVDGADKQVTYPMRRIGCESGEFILR